MRLYLGRGSVLWLHIQKVIISGRGWGNSVKNWSLGIWLLEFFIFLVIWRFLIKVTTRLLLRGNWARISSLLLYQLSLCLSKLLLCLFKLFKQLNLFLDSIRLSELHLHVFLLDCVKLFLHNGKLGLGIGLLERHPLSGLLSLDPLLREAVFKISYHLFLVGLWVLSEFVHEITHSLDFGLGIIEELLILTLQSVKVQHQFSLLLLQLKVLLPKLIQLLIKLDIWNALGNWVGSRRSRRHTQTLTALYIRNLWIGWQWSLGSAPTTDWCLVTLLWDRGNTT